MLSNYKVAGRKIKQKKEKIFMYSEIIRHVEPECDPKVKLKDESFSLTFNIQVQYRYVYG